MLGPIVVLAVILSHPPLDLKTEVVQVASVLYLAPKCGSAPGCTQFVAEQLTTDCTADRDSWLMNPSARFVAVVYLFNRNLLGHELLHVSDLKGAVTDHLTELRELRFQSETSCRQSAAAAMSGFRAMMQTFVDKSNALRR
jgi:hypothetical protein